MLNDTSVEVDVAVDADNDDVTSDASDFEVIRNEGLEVLPSLGGLAEARVAVES